MGSAHQGCGYYCFVVITCQQLSNRCIYYVMRLSKDYEINHESASWVDRRIQWCGCGLS